jgi:phosphate starvation-inducible PhoH-like protein
VSEADIQIPVHNVEEARTLLGPLDSNARLIREIHGVSVLARDGSLRLLGDADQVHRVQHTLEECLASLRAGKKVTTQDVAQRLRQGLNDEVLSAATDLPRTSSPVALAVRARTAGQHEYIERMGRNDITFAVGPAGTGKTYLAVAAAIDAVKAGRARRIVMVRPAVEAGEKLGFLPGDFQQKIDPYLRPMYDALQDQLDQRTRQRWLEGEVVEVCPLAYMRGRTLNRSFVILDEAQNTTIPQMLMFLTRLGEGSRMVVTGDPSQVDLPHNVQSGLADAVRHPVVSRVVTAYGIEKRHP